MRNEVWFKALNHLNLCGQDEFATLFRGILVRKLDMIRPEPDTQLPAIRQI